VELKYAMYLEDEGRFKDAENTFIKVGKTHEAIDMYIHQHDWVAALRVAELCDPGVMSDVQVIVFLMEKNVCIRMYKVQ
jgi:intraflagellar transport protein 172